MASTVQPAKAAIYALVVAAVQAATPGVQVTYGNAGAHMESETVWVGDAQFGDERVSIGQASHREQYTLPVVVSIAWPGDPGDAGPADVRLHAIFGPVEDAIRAARGDLGVANVTAFYVSGKSFDSYLGEAGGRVVEAVLTITVRSRY